MMIVASSLVASCGKKTTESPIDTTTDMENVQETGEIERVELLPETEDSVEVVEEIVNTAQ